MVIQDAPLVRYYLHVNGGVNAKGRHIGGVAFRDDLGGVAFRDDRRCGLQG